MKKEDKEKRKILKANILTIKIFLNNPL